MKVRVGVRIRPRMGREQMDADIISHPSSMQVNIGKDLRGSSENKLFTYDHVFPESASQQDVFDCFIPMLKDFMDGFNVTILAYGQTGSGKTFTMGSMDSTMQSPESRGLIPRFLDEIFLRLNEQKSGHTAQVQTSFLEIYGEDIFDLLESEQSGKQQLRSSLPIREEANGAVSVGGLTHLPVCTCEQAMETLKNGSQYRSTASTLMNMTSSRSHAVFTVTLTQTIVTEGASAQTECQAPVGAETDSSAADTAGAEAGAEAGAGSRKHITTIISKLTFVDLAGSERLKRTGAEGQRMREGIQINVGLLALGNVINALGDDQRKQDASFHVPYRSSKLTRLLQDALGGNSQTLFLACASPAASNFEESVNTLRYANRAKNIQNKAVKNLDAKSAELLRLQQLTDILRQELVKEKFGRQSSEAFANDNEGLDLPALMCRQDVAAYLKCLNTRAMEGIAVANVSPPSPSLLLPSLLDNTSKTSYKPTSEKSDTNNSQQCGQATSKDKERDVLSFIEVDQVADMEMLEELMEMERREADYAAQANVDQAELQEVETQISSKETILKQLADRMAQLHQVKNRYDDLLHQMSELEKEKDELLQQLEKVKREGKLTENKATTSGAKGGGKQTAKEYERKLAAVMSRLQAVREQQKKQQHLVKLAEKQASRSSSLGAELQRLREQKVTLQRRQRQQAVAHRNWVSERKQEIEAMRRSERRKTRQLTNLQIQAKRNKVILGRRNQAVSKIAAKLRATEEQMLKLLDERRRRARTGGTSSSSSTNSTNTRRKSNEAVVRGGKSPALTRKKSAGTPRKTRGGTEKEPSPEGHESTSRSEEVGVKMAAKRLLLMRGVDERVMRAITEQSLSERLCERAELLRDMLSAVKMRDVLTKELKEKKYGGNSREEGEIHLRELEQELEHLELQLGHVDLLIQEHVTDLGEVEDVASATLKPKSKGPGSKLPTQQSKREAEERKLISAMGQEEAQSMTLFLLAEVEEDRHKLGALARQSRKLQKEITAAEEAKADAAKQLQDLKRAFEERADRLQNDYETNLVEAWQEMSRQSYPEGDDGVAAKFQSSLVSGLQGQIEKLETQIKDGKFLSVTAELEDKTRLIAELRTQLSLAESKCKVLAEDVSCHSAAVLALSKFGEVWEQLGIDVETRDKALEGMATAVANRCEQELNALTKVRDRALENIECYRIALALLVDRLGGTEETQEICRQRDVPVRGVGGTILEREKAIAISYDAARQEVEIRTTKLLQKKQKAQELLAEMGIHEEDLHDIGVEKEVRLLVQLTLEEDAESAVHEAAGDVVSVTVAGELDLYVAPPKIDASLTQGPKLTLSTMETAEQAVRTLVLQKTTRLAEVQELADKGWLMILELDVSFDQLLESCVKALGVDTGSGNAENTKSKRKQKVNTQKRKVKRKSHPTEEPKALPTSWKAVKDEGSGRYYFYNVNTRETTWHHPGEADDKDESEEQEGDNSMSSPYTTVEQLYNACQCICRSLGEVRVDSASMRTMRLVGEVLCKMKNEREKKINADLRNVGESFQLLRLCRCPLKETTCFDGAEDSARKAQERQEEAEVTQVEIKVAERVAVEMEEAFEVECSHIVPLSAELSRVCLEWQYRVASAVGEREKQIRCELQDAWDILGTGEEKRGRQTVATLEKQVQEDQSKCVTVKSKEKSKLKTQSKTGSRKDESRSKKSSAGGKMAGVMAAIMQAQAVASSVQKRSISTSEQCGEEDQEEEEEEEEEQEQEQEQEQEGDDEGSLALASLQRQVHLVRLLALELTRMRAKQHAMESLSSLGKEICGLDSRITAFEWETRDKSKDRFKGRSTHFLEEERFRKHAAKRYPMLLRKLRAEIVRWEKTWGKDGDTQETWVAVLGKDIARLVSSEEEVSERTELIHLALSSSATAQQIQALRAHKQIEDEDKKEVGTNQFNQETKAKGGTRKEKKGEGCPVLRESQMQRAQDVEGGHTKSKLGSQDQRRKQKDDSDARDGGSSSRRNSSNDSRTSSSSSEPASTVGFSSTPRRRTISSSGRSTPGRSPGLAKTGAVQLAARGRRRPAAQALDNRENRKPGDTSTTGSSTGSTENDAGTGRSAGSARFATLLRTAMAEEKGSRRETKQKNSSSSLS